MKNMKLACIGKECVACGCCISTCPKEAIYIHAGVIARVDKERCIACGKCAKICPAAVINMIERRQVE